MSSAPNTEFTSTQIFGRLWDAPVCEGRTPKPAPMHMSCMDCQERIGPTDQGFLRPCFIEDDGASGYTLRAEHRECQLLHIIGHEYGLCHCTNYQGLTEREAALKLWRRTSVD